MWPQSWTKGREEVLRELRSWQGATAQGWAYSVSHSQFLVRLYRDEDLKGSPIVSLYLWLKSCDRVSFCDVWRGAHISIEEKEGQYGPEFIVTDGERLHVQCGAIFATSASESVRLEDQLK